MCLWFNTWRLLSAYFFLISPSFSTSGGFCFLIAAFPAYVHFHSDVAAQFCIKSPYVQQLIFVVLFVIFASIISDYRVVKDDRNTI